MAHILKVSKRTMTRRLPLAQARFHKAYVKMSEKGDRQQRRQQSQGEPMNLGKKLRRMRQARGLTGVELAKRSRVTPGFISQLEYSQTVPSLQTLQRVAAVLDVSLTYFLLEESLQPQVVRQRERHI